MKKVLKSIGGFFVPLLVGLFFALMLQTAFAVSGPSSGCTPSSTSGCTTYPSFTSLLVGSGTPPSTTGAFKATGDATVVGSVISDDLESYSGGVITSASDMDAAAFGTIYYEKDTSADATYSSIFTSKNPIKYARASCSSGDILLACAGGLTSYSSTYVFYGTDLYSSTSCDAMANTTNAEAIATCWSPDYTTSTGDSL